MFKVITAPNYSKAESSRRLFLAGGITNCPDWQKEALTLLEKSRVDVEVYNPRRPNFPIHDPDAANEQVKWEFDHLHKANVILFWFPKESICPIALYELGFWLSRFENDRKPQVIIGCHPEYPRLQDVQIQSSLVGYKHVFSSVPDLIRVTIKVLEKVTK
jgi:hypothetical protein